ncbi:MAG TPA: hypothetical protein VFY96_01035, partial [Candidatus Binatia bacterium]|nr:hypothetical protein [Candidatus Binatia bacterium]
VAFAALHHRNYRRYFFVIMLSQMGDNNMSNNGLHAFNGVTVGVVGGLIGIHWSLALSAMILLAVTIALFALVIPGRGTGAFR